jgi:hypothetical protein
VKRHGTLPYVSPGEIVVKFSSNGLLGLTSALRETRETMMRQFKSSADFATHSLAMVRLGTAYEMIMLINQMLGETVPSRDQRSSLTNNESVELLAQLVDDSALSEALAVQSKEIVIVVTNKSELAAMFNCITIALITIDKREFHALTGLFPEEMQALHDQVREILITS